jgi:hypothetical protein
MKWIFLIFAGMLFTACAKGGSVRYCHPENGVCISAEAEAATFPFDPLMVTITLSAPNIERELKTGVMINQLNEATCKVEWKTENTAHVIFQESDETRTIVEVYYDPLQLRMRILDSEK